MIKKRIESFSYAFQGFRTLLQDEPNARIHTMATVTTVSLGFYLQISKAEWIAIIFAIAMVISAEIFNSAIENLADLISKDFHPLIKKAKDLAAAGVLICAIGAFIIGGIIFVPKLF
jgi:diacylglycerol kinase